MFADAVVEEVRTVRREYAKRFDFNLHAIAEDLRQKEVEHRDRLVSHPPKLVQRRATA